MSSIATNLSGTFCCLFEILICRLSGGIRDILAFRQNDISTKTVLSWLFLQLEYNQPALSPPQAMVMKQYDNEHIF